MSRLPRFMDYRYIGTRDDMVFYDCDDEEQFEGLRSRVDEEDLLARNLLQAFSPDEPFEARNRGFSPRSRVEYPPQAGEGGTKN